MTAHPRAEALATRSESAPDHGSDHGRDHGPGHGLDAEARARLRRAAALLRKGRAAEAVDQAAPLAARHREDPDVLHVLGVGHHLLLKGDEARTLLERATELRPADGSLWNSLGNARRQARDLDGAAECFQRALELDPESAAAWYNLGHLHQLRGEPGAAIEALRRATELAPESFDAALTLGTALFRSGAADPAVEAEAETWFRTAHRLAPRRPEPFNNLAAVHVARGDTEAALGAFRRAIELDPRHLDAHLNLGGFEGGRGRVGEAAEAYRAARRARPDSSPVRLNLALTLLQAGYFGEAWEEYEARFRFLGEAAHPRWEVPRWDGSPLNGRRLLITEEQGHGDMIQFCRYATLVREAGGEPWIEARAALAPLLATCPGVEGVVRSRHDGEVEDGADDSMADLDFDLQIPALSLPGVFGTDLDTIPAPRAYLSPAPEPTAEAAALLAAHGDDALRVGLVWAGSPHNAGDASRSCPLAALAPLAEVAGVRLYNLLFGERGREAEAHPEMGLVDLAPHLGDFHRTAAAVHHLDLVITVDTSMAHLAGALGHPVWNLLAFVPDWRWLMERRDSPWYPSMRLFRQSEPGDWDGLARRVAAALAGRVREIC